MANSATMTSPGVYTINANGMTIPNIPESNLGAYGLTPQAAAAPAPAPVAPVTPAIPMSGGYVAQPAPSTVVQPAAAPVAQTAMLPGLGAPGYVAPTQVAPSTYDQYLTMTNNLTTAGATPAAAGQIAGAAVTPTNDSTYAGAKNYTGPSIVDFLNLAGQPSDPTSRAALAAKYGIAGYTGTAEQNTQLLHILQGLNTAVSPTGVPENTAGLIGAPTKVPTPTTPINVSQLGQGNTDVGSILNAGVTGVSVPSDIAGLLNLLNTSTAQDTQQQQYQQQLIEAMKSMGMQGADLQAEMDKQGVGANYEHAKQLNLDAARLKGELDVFDAQTEQMMSNIEDQPIPTGLIMGQKGQLQKQRDLTRLSKAAELGSIIALGQAYQGNAELGLKLAQNAVDMKYAPIENNIKVLQTQVGFAADAAGKADSTRNSIINTLLNFKMTQITDQKNQEKAMQTIAINAAAAGAPLGTIQAAMNLGDPVAMTAALAKYGAVTGDDAKLLSVSDAKALGVAYGTTVGQAKKLGITPTSASSGGGDTFTQTQSNKGAANAGMSIAQFTQLDSDTQNFFINGYATFDAMKKKIATGEMTAQEVASFINSSTTLTPKTKEILTASIGAPAAPAEGGGGFIDAIGNAFWGAANAIGSLFGI